MGYFTVGYACVQIILLVIIFRGRKIDWYTHTNTVASILTMIGVLGTFLGIFIGLWVFKINDIETSISDLLDGLKLAFLTSLVGLGSAVFLKVVSLFRTLREGKNPIEVERNKFINDFRCMFDKFIDKFEGLETSGEKNLRAELVKLNKTLEILKGMKTEITGIKGALTGGDESTVFAQLQKLTSTVSEKVGEMAEKVGEIATGQLIEALKGVIRDFNKNLTEQFGENFKQLNEAVGRTVEWQEQYRQQMDKLSEEFRIAAQSIERSETALAAIRDKSESLIAIAEKLDPILHTLNDQLEAFSKLRQQAHNAFPLIEKRLNDLTIGFSDTVKTAIDDSHSSMETQRNALATQADALQRSSNETAQQITDLTTHFSDAIKTSIAKSQAGINQQQEVLTTQLQQLQTAMDVSDQKIQQTINDIGNRLDRVFERSASHIAQVTADFTQNLTQQLTDILQGQAQEFGTIVERNRADIKNHVDNFHTDLRKAVDTLDESLKKELTTSLETLAGYFESLSNGFVNNYTQLVGPYNQVLKDLKQLVEASQDPQQPVDTSHQVRGETEGVQ